MEFGFTSQVRLSKSITSRNRAGFLFFILLVVFLSQGTLGASLASAQGAGNSGSAGTEAVPGLTVISNPQGALVELKGVASLAGLSPVFFSQGIPGIYELRVSKTGYETYKTKVQISGDRVEQVDVRLDAKTRGKAAIRSLLWPGWGQFYASQKTKGAVLTVFALTAGATVALAEIDYQDKRDNFDNINATYQNAIQAGSSANLPDLRAQLNVAQTDAHDAESLRRAAFGGAIAVWTISFLDALFFFPEVEGPITVKNISIKPEGDLIGGYAGIKISAGF